FFSEDRGNVRVADAAKRGLWQERPEPSLVPTSEGYLYQSYFIRSERINGWQREAVAGTRLVGLWPPNVNFLANPCWNDMQSLRTPWRLRTFLLCGICVSG